MLGPTAAPTKGAHPSEGAGWCRRPCLVLPARADAGAVKAPSCRIPPPLWRHRRSITSPAGPPAASGGVLHVPDSCRNARRSWGRHTLRLQQPAPSGRAGHCARMRGNLSAVGCGLLCARRGPGMALKAPRPKRSRARREAERSQGCEPVPRGWSRTMRRWLAAQAAQNQRPNIGRPWCSTRLADRCASRSKRSRP